MQMTSYSVYKLVIAPYNSELPFEILAPAHSTHLAFMQLPFHTFSSFPLPFTPPCPFARVESIAYGRQKMCLGHVLLYLLSNSTLEQTGQPLSTM